MCVCVYSKRRRRRRKLMSLALLVSFSTVAHCLGSVVAWPSLYVWGRQNRHGGCRCQRKERHSLQERTALPALHIMQSNHCEMRRDTQQHTRASILAHQTHICSLALCMQYIREARSLQTWERWNVFLHTFSSMKAFHTWVRKGCSDASL